MRHFAGLALLLVNSACAHIPDHVRVEVDGSIIEVNNAPPAARVGDDERG